jgi:hypothetical protein
VEWNVLVEVCVNLLGINVLIIYWETLGPPAMQEENPPNNTTLVESREKLCSRHVLFDLIEFATALYEVDQLRIWVSRRKAAYHFSK